MSPAGSDLLSSQVRRHIHELVSERPGELAAADLAQALDLHVSTVRFHLDQLERAGVVVAERERRDGAGRPRKVYLPAPERVPVNTDAYVILADVLVAALPGDPQARTAAAVAAGHGWAAQHVPEAAQPTEGLPVRDLVDVFARWGYPRETVTIETEAADRHRFSLAHCPMYDAAQRHPEVVCAAHLGLLRGTLSRLGVDDGDIDIAPMAAPHLCTVDVTVPGTGRDRMTPPGPRQIRT